MTPAADYHLAGSPLRVGAARSRSQGRSSGGGVVTHDYFNDRWQLIEQRKNAATTASAQFAWSAVYIDALVQEKRDSNADGTLDRTLFVTHDANFNVTAAVSPTGIAAERYLYDAYGDRRALDGDWQPSPARVSRRAGAAVRCRRCGRRRGGRPG